MTSQPSVWSTAKPATLRPPPVPQFSQFPMTIPPSTLPPVPPAQLPHQPSQEETDVPLEEPTPTSSIHTTSSTQSTATPTTGML